MRRFQAAFVSGVSAADGAGRELRLTPIGTGVDDTGSVVRADAALAPDERLDLSRLVDAIAAAHERAARATPARPWVDALPDDVTLEMLRATPGSLAGAFAFALVDEPNAQRHAPMSWVPPSGNMLIAGLAGSGTTTALCTIAAAVAAQPPDERAHLYVIATAIAPYAWLESQDHVGAVIATADDERVRRLLRMLGELIDERRGDPSPFVRPVVVLVDGIGALRTAYDSLVGLDTLDALERVATDGPAFGVHLAFAAEHPAAVGHRIDRTISLRVLLRLADRSEYAAAGVRDLDPASLVPGAGVDANGDRVQIARASADEIATPRHTHPPSGRHDRAPRIGVLPATVDIRELPRPTVARGVLHVAIGVGNRSLLPRALALHDADHVLITGPSRSGKSSLLHAVQATLEAAGLDVVMLGTRRSAVQHALIRRDAIVACIDELAAHPTTARTAVLVDDADAVDDGGALERLLAAHHHHVHVFAAARADRLRGLFRHWTNDVRRSGHAVLLRPDDAEADLVGVRLPRHAVSLPVGRGWLVSHDEPELCQFGHVPHVDLDAGHAA